MIKAVVFDLDNTLYDYDKCNVIAEKELQEVISEKFDISQDTAYQAIKIAKINVKHKLGDNVAASHNRLLYMQDICEQFGKNPLNFAMGFYEVYWDSMFREMELFDYVIPAMDWLKKKCIKIGLLTDLTAHIQYRKLSTLGLNDKIDHIVTSEEAGVEKPSPKMFSLILQKLNTLPEETLMIGDNKKKDIQGAQDVGMYAFKYENNMDIYAKLKKYLDMD